MKGDYHLDYGDDPFSGHPAPDDHSYRAYKSCKPGSVMSIDLVPGKPEIDPGFEIHYFQNWTVRYMGDWMLGIFCASTRTNVFIEGRKLTNLREKIRQRRIEAIYEYNAQRDGPLDNDAEVVTKIKVEIDNDLEAIHGPAGRATDV